MDRSNQRADDARSGGTEGRVAVQSLGEAFDGLLAELRAVYPPGVLPTPKDDAFVAAFTSSGLREDAHADEEHRSHDPASAAVRAELLLDGMRGLGLALAEAIEDRDFDRAVEAMVFSLTSVVRIRVCCSWLDAEDPDLSVRVLHVADDCPFPAADPGQTSAWWRRLQVVRVKLGGFVHRLSRADQPPPTKPEANLDGWTKSDLKRQERMKWVAEAMLLVGDHPEWSDSEIASRVGKDPSTLSRSDIYQRAAAMARGDKGDFRKGFVTRNPETGHSDVEAIAD